MPASRALQNVKTTPFFNHYSVSRDALWACNWYPPSIANPLAMMGKENPPQVCYALEMYL
jgi:hypothetical protein